MPRSHAYPYINLYVKQPLQRLFRHSPELSKVVLKRGPKSAKLLLINATRGKYARRQDQYEKILPVFSLMAPSSTLSSNTTIVSMPSDYLQSRNDTTISHHPSLIAVLVIMSLFLIITISSTGFILAFCKKKNTVFALQKCEQDSEYELDDMENTDIEMCDDSEQSPKMNKPRSRTCPSFSNLTDSDRSGESPSRIPLVNHEKKINDSASRTMVPRSFTINVLQSVATERIDLKTIDQFPRVADVNLVFENTADRVFLDVCSSNGACVTSVRRQEISQSETNSLDLQSSNCNSTLLD